MPTSLNTCIPNSHISVLLRRDGRQLFYREHPILGVVELVGVSHEVAKCRGIRWVALGPVDTYGRKSAIWGMWRGSGPLLFVVLGVLGRIYWDGCIIICIIIRVGSIRFSPQQQWSTKQQNKRSMLYYWNRRVFQPQPTPLRPGSCSNQNSAARPGRRASTFTSSMDACNRSTICSRFKIHFLDSFTSP